MTERPCIRCHHLLALEDGQLMYCSHCGAPQIFLSEELQEQAAADAQRYAQRDAQRETTGVLGQETTARNDVPEALPPAAPRSRLQALRLSTGVGEGAWPLAVGYALLSAGIALVLALLSLVFAPLSLLAWLWVISAPILTVSFYHARARRERRAAGFTPGFAARLGLLTGLLIGLSCATVFVLGLLLARFVFHTSAIDSNLAATMAQMRTQAQTQYGADAEQMIRLLGVPEFRVGFLLSTCAVTAGLYLLVAAAAGGLMGFLLGRQRPA